MVEGYYPKTLYEALELITGDSDHLLVSGGTDVMVVRKAAPKVIFLRQVTKLREIKEEEEGVLIGAGCTYCNLLKDQRVPEILRKAISQIASPAVRSAGTIGGNICNASPAGDTIPVLHVLEARVVKASLGEDKKIHLERIPIGEFILGIRKIALRPNELVLAIEIPKSSYEHIFRSYYQKVGARQSEAISKLSFAGILKMSEEKIQDVHIAFGSVGITAVRDRTLEEKLIGRTLVELAAYKDEWVLEFAKLLHPISDQRSTASYRKKVCLNLLNDFLTIDED